LSGWINAYPGKVLGFKTAQKLCIEEAAAFKLIIYRKICFSCSRPEKGAGQFIQNRTFNAACSVYSAR
jgi:hypothetical protein